MQYSNRLEFELIGMPVVRDRKLSVRRAAREGTYRRRLRHNLYLEVPGRLTGRVTGRTTVHTLTQHLGSLTGGARSWAPDPALLAWMLRRGRVKRQRWPDPNDMRREVRRLARWDHRGAIEEALAGVRQTTMRPPAAGVG